MNCTLSLVRCLLCVLKQPCNIIHIMLYMLKCGTYYTYCISATYNTTYTPVGRVRICIRQPAVKLTITCITCSYTKWRSHLSEFKYLPHNTQRAMYCCLHIRNEYCIPQYVCVFWVFCDVCKRRHILSFAFFICGCACHNVAVAVFVFLFACTGILDEWTHTEQVHVHSAKTVAHRGYMLWHYICSLCVPVTKMKSPVDASTTTIWHMRVFQLWSERWALRDCR